MLKEIIKPKTAAALLLLSLAVVSCKKEEKKTAATETKITNDTIKTTKAEEKIDYSDFNIFNPNWNLSFGKVMVRIACLSSLLPITLPSDFTSDDSDRKDSDDDSDVVSLIGNEEEKEEQTATNESDRSSTSSEDEQVHNAMIDALALEQQQQKQTPDQIRASAPTTRNPFVKFARWVKSWFN